MSHKFLVWGPVFFQYIPEIVYVWVAVLWDIGFNEHDNTILKVVPQVDCPQTSSSVPHASGRLSVLGWFHNCTEKSMWDFFLGPWVGNQHYHILPYITINYVCVLMFPVNFLTPWTAPVNVVQHLHLDSVLQNRRKRWVSIPTLTQSNDVQCIDKRIPHFDPFCMWHSQDHELVNSSNLKIAIRICGWVWIFDQYSQWHALSTLHLSCFEIPFPFFGCTCQCTLQKVRSHISWIGTDQNSSTAEAV